MGIENPLMADAKPEPGANGLRRILWFNLACDQDDPALGFAVSWIGEVAALSGHVDVVTQRVGRLVRPANVAIHSLGKERGYGRARMALEFYRAVGRLVREDRYDAAFVHMAPLLAILAFPFLRRRGIPILLWYVHPRADLRLRMAQAAADRVLTSLDGSYPLATTKLEVIGHGIDTRLFRPASLPKAERLTILAAGRISRAKNLHTLLHAIHLLARRSKHPFRLVILGSPLTGADRVYAEDLKALAKSFALDDVEFHPAVPWESMPDWYRQCWFHVDLTPLGFGDKVALEAMSCGRPSLVANPGYRDTLGTCSDRLLVASGEVDEWCEKMAALISLESEELLAMGAYLRDRVVALHDLQRLAGRLASRMRAAARRSDGADSRGVG